VTSEEEVDHLGVSTADSSIADERHTDQDDAADPEVEGGEGETCEGDGSGTQLHWHHSDGEPERQREEPVEDHPDPVRLKELKERIPGKHGVGRGRPLEGEQQAEHRVARERHHAAPREEPSDLLVIGGRRPVSHRR
jgi:hypothetical protein